MNGRNPKIDALQKEIDLEIKRIREKKVVRVDSYGKPLEIFYIEEWLQEIQVYTQIGNFMDYESDAYAFCALMNLHYDEYKILADEYEEITELKLKTEK